MSVENLKVVFQSIYIVYMLLLLLLLHVDFYPVLHSVLCLPLKQHSIVRVVLFSVVFVCVCVCLSTR